MDCIWAVVSIFINSCFLKKIISICFFSLQLHHQQQLHRPVSVYIQNNLNALSLPSFYLAPITVVTNTTASSSSNTSSTSSSSNSSSTSSTPASVPLSTMSTGATTVSTSSTSKLNLKWNIIETTYLFIKYVNI